MTPRLPLEKLDNAFDKQFMAMRYLLLGLAEQRPEYFPALGALESAAPYRAAYLKTGRVEPSYLDKLLRAFDLYGSLGRYPNQAYRMAELLAPDFTAAPAGDAGELDDEDLVAGNLATAVAAAPVPALGRVTGQFDKLFISMQYYLLGRIAHDAQFQVAYDAMRYASDIHVGFRKDGKTPEFQHQLEIAHLLRTMLKNMMYPGQTLAAVFLHDTPEDYDVPYAEVETRFGKLVADATRLLNKYDEAGNPKPLDDYYAALASCPIASLAKPGDNGHNQSTMAGVFGYKKQFEYSLGIRQRSWDMVKVARRLWPQQEAAYENLKFLLRVQYNAVQAMLSAVEFDPVTGQVHPALQK
jgi:hypothetical protein